MATKIKITEVSADGGECAAGNRHGYKTAADAFRVAKKLAVKSGLSHCVAEYEVVGDLSDCLEVLGYEHPTDD